MSEYLDTLVSGFWDYQQKVFPNWKIFFDQPEKSNKRPPVFLKNRADYNVLMKPGISPEKRRIILNQLLPRSRHKWFGSMKSSQALAQSVFANLKEYGTMNEKKADPKTVKITVCYSDSVRTATILRLIRIIKRLSRIYLFLDHRSDNLKDKRQ